MYEFSWFDLTPYILMVVILTAVMRRKGDLKKKSRICFLFLFVFAAIRYGIGYDYYSYVKLVRHQVEDFNLARIEPLSRALVEIGFKTHYQFFFVLCSFLTLYPLYKACQKLSINPAYSLLIYFLFPRYYLESFSIVRNAISYSFVLYGFVLLYQKKLLWSFLMILMATLFHKSAIVGIFIYPLYYLRFGIKFHIIIYVISFVGSNFAMKFIGDIVNVLPFFQVVEHYAEFARNEGGMMTFVINGLCVFHFFIWNKLVKTNPNNIVYLVYFNIGGCIWNVFLPIDSTIALRLSSIFQIFVVFLVPQYKYAMKYKYRELTSTCVYVFFIMLFMSYFYISINAYLHKPDRMSNLPYQTIFFHRDYSNYVY